MRPKLKIDRIKNVFTGARQSWIEDAGRFIAQYLPATFNAERGIVELNGQRIDRDRWIRTATKAGDHLMYADVPGPPVVFVAWWFGIYSGLKKLGEIPTPPKIKRPPERRTFNSVGTTVGPNQVIPVILGRMRCGGHVVETAIRDPFVVTENNNPSDPLESDDAELPRQLYMKVVWCWGPANIVAGSHLIDQQPLLGGRQLVIDFNGNHSQAATWGFGEVTRAVESVSSGIIDKDRTPDYTYTTQRFVDSLEIDILFASGIYSRTSRGKFKIRRVDVRVEYRKLTNPPGGSWTTYKGGDITLAGANPAAIHRRIRVAPLEGVKYEVKITRETADSVDSTEEDEFSVDSFTEIQSGSHGHPGIARSDMLFVPEDQQQAPREVSVIVEAPQDCRVYTAPGVYTKQHTRNPAWLCAYWLTHPLIGPGRAYTYTDTIEPFLQDWIDWADFCDQLQADGSGGFERRCSFDAELRQPLKAAVILEAFENAGQAWVIDQAGGLRVVIDRDEPPVRLFTEGVYLKDSLTVDQKNVDNRVTVVNNTFQNEALEWDPDPVPVEDPTVGVGEANVYSDRDLMGITRYGQVQRNSLRELHKQRLIDSSCRFEVGLTAVNFRIGQIFRLGSRTARATVRSGMVLKFLPNLEIQIDKEMTLEPGTTYEVVLEDDAGNMDSQIVLPVTRTTKTTHLGVSGIWSTTPDAGFQYTVGKISLAYQTYRCTNTMLQSNLTRTIEGERHTPLFEDQSSLVGDTEITRYTGFNPKIVPGAVRSLSGVAVQIEMSASNDTQAIALGWEAPITPESALIDHYEVYSREVEDPVEPWLFIATTKRAQTMVSVGSQSVSGLLEPSTEYEFLVVAVSPGGARLPIEDASVTDGITTGSG